MLSGFGCCCCCSFWSFGGRSGDFGFSSDEEEDDDGDIVMEKVMNASGGFSGLFSALLSNGGSLLDGVDGGSGGSGVGVAVTIELKSIVVSMGRKMISEKQKERIGGFEDTFLVHFLIATLLLCRNQSNDGYKD